MSTKKSLTKTNLNLKIFFTSIFLIFIFSLSIFSNANACNCACATDTVIGFVCLDYCGEGGSYCQGTKASLTKGPGLENPTDYISLNYRYERAPDGYEKNGYAMGNPIERFYGYRPYYRVFIPPGTIDINLSMISNFYVMGGTDDPQHEGSVTNFNSPPKGDPAPVNWPVGASNADCFQGDVTSQRGYFFEQLRNKECHSIAWQGFLDPIKGARFDPASNDQGGWMYVKVSNIAGRDLAVPFVNGLGDNAVQFTTQFSVTVDTKIYNEWWDHSGSNADGSINWDKDVESVTAYIAPVLTSPTQTPTCKADFSKTEITAPGESKLSFSSENTNKLVGSCTGLLPIEELKLPLSYADYSFPFLTNQTGTETCTLTPYNGTIKGADCQATVTVKNSTASTPKPSLTATISNLDANFTITNGTSCINYMCDTTTKTMVASKEDFEYQKSFVCHYTKAGNYTASIECPDDIITKIVTVRDANPTSTPTPTPKSCQRDNPDCEKITCNNVYCNDGCERKKGTRVCDGR